MINERAKLGVGMGAELDADSRRSSMISPRTSTAPRDSLRTDGVVLSKNVVVESNAIVEAAEVGEGSVIEVGAVLGKGCYIGKVRIPCLKVDISCGIFTNSTAVLHYFGCFGDSAKCSFT